jgi:hypothetical protein
MLLMGKERLASSMNCWGRGCHSVLEHLPSTLKALGSILSTTKIKAEGRKEEKGHPENLKQYI